MPTEGEVLSEPILTNIDCVGQNEICEEKSHGECNHGLFCVTERDLDLIDIDDLVLM